MKGQNFTVLASCLIPLPFWSSLSVCLAWSNLRWFRCTFSCLRRGSLARKGGHVQTHEAFHYCPLDGLRNSRYRRAGPFHVHLVGKKLRLPSNHELQGLSPCQPSPRLCGLRFSHLHRQPRRLVQARQRYVHTSTGLGEHAQGTSQDSEYAASYGSAKDGSARRRVSGQWCWPRPRARKGSEPRSEPVPLDSMALRYARISCPLLCIRVY